MFLTNPRRKPVSDCTICVKSYASERIHSFYFAWQSAFTVLEMSRGREEEACPKCGVLSQRNVSNSATRNGFKMLISCQYGKGILGHLSTQHVRKKNAGLAVI